MKPDQLNALKHAALFIDGIYQWADKIEAAGGTTSIGGIAAAHAFMNSLKKNKARTIELIAIPLKDAMQQEPSVSQDTQS